MDNFKTFQEDLASGRPAKKPVSSNLLKQRAKDNEKALKSGFMKMPDYVKKKFNEEEEMKPHKMYKGDKVVVAKNKAEHDKLNKQGYTHDDPKTKKVEEEKKNCGCGQDPCITYGKGGKKVEEATAAEVLKKRYASDHPDDNPHNQKRIKDHHGMKTYKMHPGAKVTAGGEFSKKGKMKALKKQIKRRPEQYGVTEAKQKGIDGKVCWDGYKRMGTKKKGGKTVDNCVKIGEEIRNAFASYYESALDKYNPVVSDKRTKEKLKKAGLPPESPKVMEAKQKTVHIHTGQDKLKTLKIKYNKPIKTKVTDIGPGGKEVVRKDWSEGLERDPKSNSFNRTKRKETTVRVGQKRDKKTGKMVDVMGKSSAPQGLPSMKEHQIQLVTNLDFNEGLSNLVSRGLGNVRKAIKDAEKRTGYKVDPAKRKIANPVSGDNIRKRLESQKKR